MEFWGVEVKAGQPLKVVPDDGKLIHISQAALGEGKKDKGNAIIPLRVKINDKTFVVGSLSAENFPQITFDLVFEKEFELSHDWKNGSIYFCGYMAENPYEEDDGGDFDESESDEDIPTGITENGKMDLKVEEVKQDASKSKAGKPESVAPKPKVTVVEPKKEDSDEDNESDEDDSDDDEDMLGASDDISGSDAEDDSDSEDESDEDEETPKKVVPNKKRPNESATNTPVPAKKGKVDTPQKTDGKKGSVHVATPHPSKQAGKTPASNKPQTPKSDSKVTCTSCSKTFNSENALQSHSKAKHAAK